MIYSSTYLTSNPFNIGYVKVYGSIQTSLQVGPRKVGLEVRVHEMLAECSRRAEVKAKLDDKVKELKNLVEELKVDTIEKDTRLDHLQKRSNKLSILLGEAKGEAIKEFKASNEFTDLLVRNYATRFEDFKYGCNGALS